MQRLEQADCGEWPEQESQNNMQTRVQEHASIVVLRTRGTQSMQSLEMENAKTAQMKTDED